MVAVRPTFHEPALLAKQAANIDHISGGRLSLNVVSSWWADEATQYGVPVRPARRPLRAHRGMARRGRRAVAAERSSRIEGKLLPHRGHGARAEAGAPAAADDLRRRRVGDRAGFDRTDQGLDGGWFVQPTVFADVDNTMTHRPGGDLRPGAGVIPRRPRTTPSASPTTRSMAWPARSGPPTPRRRWRSRRRSAPALMRSTCTR